MDTKHTPSQWWLAMDADEDCKPEGCEPTDIIGDEKIEVDGRKYNLVSTIATMVEGDLEANARLIAAAPELLEEVKRLREIAALVTIKQIIDAGDSVIDAAGLDPWCLNEGKANADDRWGYHWKTDDLLAKAAREEGGQG